MTNFEIWDVTEKPYFPETLNISAKNKKQAIEHAIGHDVVATHERNMRRIVYTDGRRKFVVNKAYTPEFL